MTAFDVLDSLEHRGERPYDAQGCSTLVMPSGSLVAIPHGTDKTDAAALATAMARKVLAAYDVSRAES